MAYRWFIGYPLNERVPHFSTVSYNFKHRFNTASVEYVRPLENSASLVPRALCL
ncbi:transposase [Gemmiger sp.]